MSCTRSEHITRVLKRLYSYDMILIRREILRISTTFADDRIYIVFMYRHLISILVIHSCIAQYAPKVDALAVTPQGSISPPTLGITAPQSLPNETTQPPQNFISYHVPNSRTTLDFHSFERPIPIDYVLRTVSFAVSIAFDHISDHKGRIPIVGGIFVFSHQFTDRKTVEIVVNDFREDGKPMTYFVLMDVLRGLGEFALIQGNPAKEVSFEVSVEGIGYLATGHVDFKDVAPSTSAVV